MNVMAKLLVCIAATACAMYISSPASAGEFGPESRIGCDGSCGSDGGDRDPGGDREINRQNDKRAEAARAEAARAEAARAEAARAEAARAEAARAEAARAEAARAEAARAEAARAEAARAEAARADAEAAAEADAISDVRELEGMTLDKNEALAEDRAAEARSMEQHEKDSAVALAELAMEQRAKEAEKLDAVARQEAAMEIDQANEIKNAQKSAAEMIGETDIMPSPGDDNPLDVAEDAVGLAENTSQTLDSLGAAKANREAQMREANGEAQKDRIEARSYGEQAEVLEQMSADAASAAAAEAAKADKAEAEAKAAHDGGRKPGHPHN